MAATLLTTMFAPTRGALGMDAAFFLPVLLVAAWWAMRGPNVFEMAHGFEWRSRITRTVQLAACLAVILGSRASPFLYFQF
jgi:hypothetical protein